MAYHPRPDDGLTATQRYHNKCDAITIRPRLEDGEFIRSAAEYHGLSVTKYILTACKERFDHFDRDLLRLQIAEGLAEVVFHSFLILFNGDLLGVVYQMTDGIERIGHIGDTEALRTGEVIDSTAFLQRFAAADAIFHHTGLEGERATLGVRQVNGVVGVDHQLDEVVHLRSVGLLKFLVGLHGRYVGSGGADLYALVHTAGEDHFQGTAHIEERGIVPTVRLCALLRLYATDDAIISRIFKSKPSCHNGRNNYFVVIVSRQARTKTGERRYPTFK